MLVHVKWASAMCCQRCARTFALALASESNTREDGIIEGADGRKILFECSKREDPDDGAASSVNPAVVNGRAVFEAISDFERYRFVRATNGRSPSNVDFRLTQIFEKHFRVRVDVVLKSETGPDRLLHSANRGGKCVFDYLLNAKTFLNFPTVGNLIKRPSADG